MAVIAFYSDEKKETGQTFSIASVASYMGIEHNYRIILVSTNFNDVSLENCFWDVDKVNQAVQKITDRTQSLGIESGIEGLVKISQSNKTTPDIISNYTRIILKNRLDVLPSPKTKIYEEYKQIAESYPDILTVANRAYDMVFVDVSKRMDDAQARKILDMADVVVLNITQRLSTINRLMELRQNDEFYKQKKIMIAIGRYDSFSKYSNKNITRYMKEKRMLSVVPYNTLLFEACSEGKIIDFFLNIRNLDETDRNSIYRNEVKKFVSNILYKLQELQMRI